MEETNRHSQPTTGKNTLPEELRQKPQVEKTSIISKAFAFVQDLLSPAAVEPDPNDLFITKNPQKAHNDLDIPQPRDQYKEKSINYPPNRLSKYPPSSLSYQTNVIKGAGNFDNNKKYETLNLKTSQKNTNAAIMNDKKTNGKK